MTSDSFKDELQSVRQRRRKSLPSGQGSACRGPGGRRESSIP